MGKKSRRNVIGWVGTAIAAAGCVGAAIAAATLTVPPDDLMPAVSAKQIAVGKDSFDDARPVQLRVSGVASAQLFAPSPGKVTAFACETGATVNSGESLLALDGEPKLALATVNPLWRDVTLGSQGDDVRGFQDELLRLGFALETDGVAGRDTIDVAKSAFADIGVALKGDIVPLASLVWIPAATATISTCEASIGADVQRGAPLATFTSVSPKVSLVDTPKDLLPGPRIVRIDGSDFAVAPTGDIQIADVSELGTSVVADSTDPRSKPVDAQLALAEPRAVSVVPPGAVYDVEGSSGCVSSKGVGHRIDVLGSRLGETIVTFLDGEPPTHVDTPPRHRAPCA